MSRRVRNRFWLRVTQVLLAVVLLVLIGLGVWLSTGGWAEVKLSQRVMQLRADPEDISRGQHSSPETVQKELFAALEAVGPDRPAFRQAYRDIVIIGAPELSRMSLFTPYVFFAAGLGGADYQRGCFFSLLAGLLRKHPNVCLPVVLELLGHPDPDVQGVATGCLAANIPDTSPPPDRIDCQAVIEQQKVEVVARLIPMLRHPRHEVRLMAAEIMGRGFGQLESKAVLELATQFRDERDQAVYFAISRSLGQIPRWWESADGRRAVPVIADAMADPDKRRTAVDHLIPAGAEARAAIPQAIKLLQDADDEGRLQALRLLLATSPDAKATAEAVPELIALLQKPNDGFRTDTQLALDFQCRMEALKVLKALGRESRTAAPAVRALLENRFYQSEAANTLKAIVPE